MTTRIVGVFADPQQARQALSALRAQNLPTEAINGLIQTSNQSGDAEADAAKIGGVAIGSGTLAMAGLVSLAVIGIGPLLAAGPFAAALGLAASANAKHANQVSQIAEALTHSGLTETQAQAYAQRVSEGNSLLAVDIPDDQVNTFADILHANGGAGLDFRPVA